VATGSAHLLCGSKGTSSLQSSTLASLLSGHRPTSSPQLGRLTTAVVVRWWTHNEHAAPSCSLNNARIE
jgi:hypothetical protein